MILVPCPGCGAPLPGDTVVCPRCDTWLDVPVDEQWPTARQLSPCPACGVPARGRYCSAHRARGERRGSTRAWRKLRALVLAEEPWCRRRCGRRSAEVNHIVAVVDGGALLDRGNCEGLCHRCHVATTKAQARARARRGGRSKIIGAGAVDQSCPDDFSAYDSGRGESPAAEGPPDGSGSDRGRPR